MEMSAPLHLPPMPRDYYRWHAERVRQLAREATMPDIRDHLANIAREYENLAEEAEAGDRALG
jgi:formate dehydrogenase maturation protein FdhE